MSFHKGAHASTGNSNDGAARSNNREAGLPAGVIRPRRGEFSQGQSTGFVACRLGAKRRFNTKPIG